MRSYLFKGRLYEAMDGASSDTERLNRAGSEKTDATHATSNTTRKSDGG